jgi:hypothetical protein
LSDIVNNLDFVSKNDILIFEGRRAKKELEKFLNNKK